MQCLNFPEMMMIFLGMVENHEEIKNSIIEHAKECEQCRIVKMICDDEIDNAQRIHGKIIV